MDKVIEVFKSYPESVSAICAIFMLIGAVVGFIVKYNIEKRNRKHLNIAETDRENEKLKEELSICKDKLQKFESLFSKDVIKADNGDCYFWKKNNEKICPVCWTSQQKIVPVNDIGNTGYYECNICKKEGIYDYRIVDHVKTSMNSAISNFYDE